MLSALSGLYQMTFAGFFVHLNSIPPELRWLQWMCPLKYALEALSVNEVNSGLEIRDTLQGVPVTVSAALIMNLVRFCVALFVTVVAHSHTAVQLFGFDEKNYYRDVLVLCAYILGFAASVLAVVWIWVRETR